MFLKIIIIASVLILGVFVFSETSGVFPNSDVFDFVKENANTLEAKTTESVETGIGFVKTMGETDSKINNQINTVKESSKNLSKKISEINPLKKVEDVFTNNPTDEPTSTTSANQSNKDPIIKFDYSGSPIYENLSLSMIQQSNGDILLEYYDVTGNTKSASIVIRTSDKEIFSGTFFTSNFKTVINDVSETYYVDVTVEHKDYGTVKSSIFNSGNNLDSKIDGKFQE